MTVVDGRLVVSNNKRTVRCFEVNGMMLLKVSYH